METTTTKRLLRASILAQASNQQPTQIRTWDELFRAIPSEYKQEFIRYIRTGTALQPFLLNLERDEVLSGLADSAMDLFIQGLTGSGSCSGTSAVVLTTQEYNSQVWDRLTQIPSHGICPIFPDALRLSLNPSDEIGSPHPVPLLFGHRTSGSASCRIDAAALGIRISPEKLARSPHLREWILQKSAENMYAHTVCEQMFSELAKSGVLLCTGYRNYRDAREFQNLVLLDSVCHQLTSIGLPFSMQDWFLESQEHWLQATHQMPTPAQEELLSDD